MPTNTIVTGPVTGGRRGWPFSLPLTDLGSVAYLAEEFFLDGIAAAYEAEPGAEFAVDGNWQVRPSRTAPFRIRVLVVRPVDAARFNGVVHINWQNVTAGFELGTADLESEQLLDGFAWVGVSAQQAGVHGLPGTEQFALRGWDPERYGTLDHPGDDFSFDHLYTGGALDRIGANASWPAPPLRWHVPATSHNRNVSVSGWRTGKSDGASVSLLNTSAGTPRSSRICTGTVGRISLGSIAGSRPLVSGSAPSPKSTTNKKPSKSRTIG